MIGPTSHDFAGASIAAPIAQHGLIARDTGERARRQRQEQRPELGGAGRVGIIMSLILAPGATC